MIKPKVDPALALPVGALVVICAYLSYIGMYHIYTNPESATKLVGIVGAIIVIWIVGEIAVRLTTWILS